MTRRLLFSYLSLTLFVLLLLELPLAVFFRDRETDRLSADVERDATVLATIFADSLEAGTVVDPAPAGDYTSRTGARVVVVDRAGISLLDTDSDQRRDFSTRPEFESALTGGRASGTRHSDTLDTELLYVAVPIASGGQVHGALRLTFDTQEVQDRVRAFWWGLAAIGGVILVVVAAVGWALSRSITRPVRRLQSTAARFSRGDLTQTSIDAAAPPELVDLEKSLNAMATRLSRLIDQQRAFVADASHQLRTPLTALQLRLENLGSEVQDEKLREDVEATLAETERLGDLVTDLLQLASAEQVVSVGTYDIVALAEQRVTTWTAVADQQQVSLDLRVDGPNTMFAQAVPGAVEQILDNLLSNAIDVAPPSSEVVVELTSGSANHALVVIDQGRGLTELQRVQALDRFWRADSSKPGTGLGLAIVRSLVEASGGTVELAAATPTGIRAEVSLLAVAASQAGHES